METRFALSLTQPWASAMALGLKRIEIRFEVLGNPVTQGSGKAINDRSGHARFIPDHRAPLAAWRTDIHNAAEKAAEGRFAPKGTPVWVVASFRLQRPKSAPRRVIRPTTKPDIDKLARASLDAMTGVVFADDSQVVSLALSKCYALPDQPPGAVFEVAFTVAENAETGTELLL